ADYAGEVVRLKSAYDNNLWISDDDYQSFRASHAKANAYDDALKKAVPAEWKNRVGVGAPDSTTIPDAPSSVSKDLEDLGNVGKNAVNAATEFGKLAIGGLVIVGGISWYL